MATLGRWIEPKPSTNITDPIPLLLVPVNRQSAVAIPTQIIPRTIFIDAQSLQTNMVSNREGIFLFSIVMLTGQYFTLFDVIALEVVILKMQTAMHGFNELLLIHPSACAGSYTSHLLYRLKLSQPTKGLF